MSNCRQPTSTPRSLEKEPVYARIEVYTETSTVVEWGGGKKGNRKKSVCSDQF